MSTLQSKIFEAKFPKAGYTARVFHSGDDGKKFEAAAISGQPLGITSDIPTEIATDSVGANGGSPYPNSYSKRMKDEG